jgi:hypothetical protein
VSEWLVGKGDRDSSLKDISIGRVGEGADKRTMPMNIAAQIYMGALVAVLA